MNDTFIIDAHAHTGPPGIFFSPEYDVTELLASMDRANIRLSVVVDHLSIFKGPDAGLPLLRKYFEESGKRIHFLGVFDPRFPGACMKILKDAVSWPGFAGLKIHPSVHLTAAEDPAYEPAWQFAAKHDVPIMTHSWSTSDYNPVQKYSTPGRFEKFIRKFPSVRFVLGHAGGRGAGRLEAVRLTNEYPNVFLDFSGDIFCYRLIEDLTDSVPAEKILFGSDYPWLDPRANLDRVFLADIDVSAKKKILRDNAASVYRLEPGPC